MKKPLVSIIIPVFNVEKYFDRCMDSILNQTIKDIEIILVDDESPDSCPVKCDNYLKYDSRIKVIHKKNEGLGLARNSGLEIATGEYVAFVDSDDYVDREMFEKLYSTAKLYFLDTVYCGYSNVDLSMKTQSFSEVPSLQIFDSIEEIQNVLLDMIASNPKSKIERKYRMSVWHGIYLRKQIIDNKIRFHSEREFISEDLIFHIDYLSKSSKVAFLPDPLYFYCYNTNSLTKTFIKDRFVKQVVLYKAINQRLTSLKFSEQIFKNRVDRLFFGYVRTTIRSISHAAISYIEKQKLVKEICLNTIWQSLANYPINQMSVKHKTIMFLIRFKMINSLLLLFRIK